MHEAFLALAVVAEPPAPQTDAIMRALGIGERAGAQTYTELFTLSLYPYASVYLGVEGMLGGEARDRIAGFWRAMGSTPPAEPDHLAVLLGAYASLEERESECADSARRESWRHARGAFLFEHLLSWLPAYLAKAEEIALAPYAAWARILRDALLESAQAFPTPTIAPLHLRDAPSIADPREEGSAAFIASLLAPARSGMILTRADLARAASELSLGLRQGERRFALEALLGADARGILGWLAREAARWCDLHRSWPIEDPTREHWIVQADCTSTVLHALAASLSELHAFGT